MAVDNRDWYRDWWRKKTGYVERAAFRMSEADKARARRWERVKLAAALLSVAAISAGFYYLRKIGFL